MVNLYGVYYGSREYAKEHNDPLLDVVCASSQEDAERIAKNTVKDHGAGLHLVPLSYYEEQYSFSAEGSDLRLVYGSLIHQIKTAWAQKNK